MFLPDQVVGLDRSEVRRSPPGGAFNPTFSPRDRLGGESWFGRAMTGQERLRGADFWQPTGRKRVQMLVAYGVKRDGTR